MHVSPAVLAGPQQREAFTNAHDRRRDVDRRARGRSFRPAQADRGNRLWVVGGVPPGVVPLFGPLGLEEFAREHFDGDQPVHRRMAGLEDPAHAAPTELVEDAILAELKAAGPAGQEHLGLNVASLLALRTDRESDARLRRLDRLGVEASIGHRINYLFQNTTFIPGYRTVDLAVPALRFAITPTVSR